MMDGRVRSACWIEGALGASPPNRDELLLLMLVCAGAGHPPKFQRGKLTALQNCASAAAPTHLETRAASARLPVWAPPLLRVTEKENQFILT